ncbi:calcium-binding protein [Candidatus Enterovibrio escicola]|uniref:calcium-binding protein n=1 Tax=Candidatus Enterovibrio escicola TaxID=1927127 RepID=UPI001680C575|nr:calcium-binding protein [Candidatus Enterovibrio escacola]
MTKVESLFSGTMALLALSIGNYSIAAEELQGCIVSLESNERYCLPVGQRSGYSLPDWINGHEVYVQASEGAAVMLSDMDNLSYHRLAIFSGTVTNQQLINVGAINGDRLNLSNPKSMRVVRDKNPLGCIISLKTKDKYCLPVGKSSDSSLPSWIKGHSVYVQASAGTAVMLSGLDNLSSDHLATFSGTVTNDKLIAVKALNGETLDFSTPHSMRVVSSDKALGCIISLESNDRFCLPVGQSSGYALPNWIKGHEIYVQASQGAGVMLSNWYDLTDTNVTAFAGTVNNQDLVSRRAVSGKEMDFSAPFSMKVVSDNQPLGCIVSLETNAKYCSTVFWMGRHKLPSWIYEHKISIQAAGGAAVAISERERLPYQHTVTFAGTVASKDINLIRADNYQLFDLSKPTYIEVVKDKAHSQILNGGYDNDIIYGSTGHDVIKGNDGSDTLYGNSGDDIIYGGSGHDTLYGGSGKDQLFGDGGFDSLYGNAGNDILHAGSVGDSLMDGGTGFDLYIGSQGNDTMVFDQEDFSDEGFIMDHETIYNGNKGFDILLVKGDANIDFSGSSFFSDSSIVSYHMAMTSIEAVIAGEGDQMVTIDGNAIYDQSNAVEQGSTDVNPEDWNGFVAWLGAGNDTFNLKAGGWRYYASGAAPAPLSSDMIASMSLSQEQVDELHSYIFSSMGGKRITVWTDANTVQLGGVNIH